VAAIVQWAGGGTGEIVLIDAERIQLRSTRPSPPGSRIEGAIVLRSTGDAAKERAVSLRVKIHGCRKQQDATFLLDGRPLDLAREDREALLST
jgi:hypothetical protein